MLFLYLILLTLAILFLGSLIPLIQFIIAKRQDRTGYEFTFAPELIDHDIDFEFRQNQFSRAQLVNRGWIRGPQGNGLTANDFEQKKNDEYNIKLP